jgi:RNA polymerase sigma-70 factor, ECF subfamily
MSATDVTHSRDEAGEVVAAAKAGDESAFSALAERYRRELQVHCYRMLGSFEDSEDLVQETLLRAWSKRASFQGRSTFRAWLYRIATNACLDVLDRRPRQPAGEGATATASGAGPGPEFEVPWLQPYPDRLLEGIAAPDAEPDAAVVGKETIELAFLVAIQQLPPRQRAVLILRGVLGWSAKETASLLETSVASVNSALQRARATLRRHLPERRAEWAPGSDPSEEERALLRRYVDANEKPDPDAFVEMMRDDARFAMPPQPGTWVGAEAIVDAWKAGGFGSDDFGAFRCLVTRANAQPAVACYVRRPGDSEYRSLALDVLRISDGLIAEITTFPSDVFEAFELPPSL